MSANRKPTGAPLRPRVARDFERAIAYSNMTGTPLVIIPADGGHLVWIPRTGVIHFDLDGVGISCDPLPGYGEDQRLEKLRASVTEAMLWIAEAPL